MKQNLKWISLATLLFSVQVIAAGELKIGFVNSDRIVREAGPAQKAQKKLEKEFAVREAELQKMAKQVRDLQTQLEKETVTLSEADKRNKERDLGNLNRDFQRMQREFREDLNMRKNEELAGVQERASKIIKEIAEADKFDLIIQDAVFASSKIDITDKVLKALAVDK
ncbi:MAG: OmpH family outer membrane protein [Burkholderiales bacterium]